MIGGIDSHKDTIHVAVITGLGVDVADREFTTTQAGYHEAIDWLRTQDCLDVAGVEGTSSYGLGVTTALREAGARVIEVNRTRAAERRRKGKSDRLDAYRAARGVLSGEASTIAKSDTIEPLRAVHNARKSAVKAKRVAWQQISATLINAPAPLRDRYRGLAEDKAVQQLIAARPARGTEPAVAGIMVALKVLARRHRALSAEIDELGDHLAETTTAINPGLAALQGVGPVVAAQLLITAGDNSDRLRSEASFAALCGTAPVQVSSGRVTRHRLSRGGDRQANAALHHIVTNRLRHDPRTRDYRDARLAKGGTKAAAMRALKRAVAREVFRALRGRCPVPDYSDLRPARQARNLTLAAVAAELKVWPSALSQLELGQRVDNDLVARYRNWLTAA